MVQYLSGMDCGHHCDNQSKAHSKAAMIQEAPYFIYARDPYHIFALMPRARAAKVSEANQQCHFKSSQCGMKLLCTDSWLPPNSSHGSSDV